MAPRCVPVPRSARLGVFTTHLSGPDTAKLLFSGWVPAAVVFGVSAAVAHIDRITPDPHQGGLGTGELGSCTTLVTGVSADARRRFTQYLRQTGADRGIVDTSTVTVRDVAPYPQHRDYLAVASLLGTALASRPRTAVAAPPRTLSMLPVRRPPPDP